jgi:hypothetical protein
MDNDTFTDSEQGCAIFCDKIIKAHSNATNARRLKDAATDAPHHATITALTAARH